MSRGADLKGPIGAGMPAALGFLDFAPNEKDGLAWQILLFQCA